MQEKVRALPRCLDPSRRATRVSAASTLSVSSRLRERALLMCWRKGSPSLGLADDGLSPLPQEAAARKASRHLLALVTWFHIL
jgi:hypothetical protein